VINAHEADEARGASASAGAGADGKARLDGLDVGGDRLVFSGSDDAEIEARLDAQLAAGLELLEQCGQQQARGGGVHLRVSVRPVHLTPL